jgi:hypothetical protein
MSQPFYNNNEMRNEAELNERLPKSKGMNIVGIIDKLDFKKYVVGVTQETYKNDVRFDTDNTPQTVAKFQKLIKEGDYQRHGEARPSHGLESFTKMVTHYMS